MSTDNSELANPTTYVTKRTHVETYAHDYAGIAAQSRTTNEYCYKFT
jgi:hypothetical protein